MTAPQSRPRVVTAAFWCWVTASLLLMLGGLIAASLNVPAVFRGAGGSGFPQKDTDRYFPLTLSGVELE